MGAKQHKRGAAPRAESPQLGSDRSERVTPAGVEVDAIMAFVAYNQAGTEAAPALAPCSCGAWALVCARCGDVEGCPGCTRSCVHAPAEVAAAAFGARGVEAALYLAREYVRRGRSTVDAMYLAGSVLEPGDLTAEMCLREAAWVRVNAVAGLTVTVSWDEGRSIEARIALFDQALARR